MKHVMTYCLQLTTLSVFIAVFASIVPQSSLAQFGDERTGISMYSLLKVGAGARATALSEAIIATDSSAIMSFWNPAGLALSPGNSVSASITNWIGGVVVHSFSANYKIDTNTAVGLSLGSTIVGDIKLTTEFLPQGNGQTFSFGSQLMGLSFSSRLTEQFSAGFTVKYLRDVFGILSSSAVIFDAGTLYKTGLGNSRLAVAVSNFGGRSSPSGSVSLRNSPQSLETTRTVFQSFDPPITFRFGVAFDPISEIDERLTTAIQLNHPNDNAENYCAGVEYARRFSEAVPFWIALRGGYKLNVREEQVSAGIGLTIPLSQSSILELDYSFVALTYLNSVHRLSLNLLL